jgi:hypothetical protein
MGWYEGGYSGIWDDEAGQNDQTIDLAVLIKRQMQSADCVILAAL